MSRKKLTTAVNHEAVKVEADQVEAQLKNQNKNIRQSLEEQRSPHILSEQEKVRLAIGKQMRLDASFYENLPEYQDKQLFWCPDIEKNNQVRIGAQPVPSMQQAESFPGFNDKLESDWVFEVVGEKKDGSPELNYLMFMDRDLYYKYKIEPNIARNEAIQRSLGRGEANVDEPVMSGVTGMETYNPEISPGKRGLVTETKHKI